MFAAAGAERDDAASESVTCIVCDVLGIDFAVSTSPKGSRKPAPSVHQNTNQVTIMQASFDVRARLTVTPPLVVAPTEDPSLLELVERGRARANESGFNYYAEFLPDEAWSLVQAGAAVLLDVRTAEERLYVGHVPGSLHVAWQTGTGMTKNPRFTRELESRVGRDALLILLCRSGNRSTAAAEAATKAGFQRVANVREGFEAQRDEQGQRGRIDGWRLRGLPWLQD